MPNFNKGLSMCAEMYRMMMWFVITRRRELANPLGMVEEWKVVGEHGRGRFEGEGLRRGMEGWTEKESYVVVDLARTVETINWIDEGRGREVALDFKMTHWCWSRRS